MEPSVIISKCLTEYERLITIVESRRNIDDIDFFDHCEESTSTMLIELNELLKSTSPNDDFREAFKKIHDLNAFASQQVLACEQRQRDHN